MTTSESCLHCHEGNKVQVSCDACHAFICVDCHWCHEFQANHEIRVCDRCDSFLCKDCEDMEQCHDCGEVVCKSCGNLLTCKFCGSSLCEECATACAKCGIVLCGRDAKFAVDCDTCKLSYCLVCLASGQKETCIRCHARPSKRMEQLVHLRLKSIYKAFQQSARTNDAHPHLKRAALAAMKSSKEPKIDPVVAKAQADAAAAELLAELEEEETKAQEAVQSKSKKKRKKKKKGGEHHEADEVKTPSEDLKMEASASSQHKTDTKKNGSVTAKADQNSKKVPPNGESVPDKPPAAPDVKKEEEKTAVTEEDLHQPDPMQTKLCELVNAEDTKGIEDLLEEWKGVPGKSALRKNAKKALKRLSCTTTSKPALKIISTTPKSTTTQETVMEMDPRIVGYVIGKGGQTIRDLMDESGAKVWIDQESMGTNEARVAYVSGAKKAVNIAVKMIQDLVREAEAPLPTTTTTQEADVPAAGEADPQGKGEDTAKAKDGPLPPGWVREEITCEARFVPLLIGRRGWTIKHIQDASGAKVDIDQSVTPRIISLSGTPESVQTAKRLVSNVLSYPHDQLKNDGSAIDETELFARGDGTHSPPPSSYVMTGDIKSVISASSSLSSTPEPSMASSKGRDFVMPPPGLFDNSNRGSDVPLAQRYSHPAYGETFAHQQQQQQAPPSQQNFAQMQQQPPNLAPPGHAMVGNMQQHQQQPPPPPHRGPPMMGPMPGMPPHMQQQQPQLPMRHPHNQQPMPGGIHMNPGLMSQHRMTMQQQQQQQMVMAQQRASFMSHGNPNEASMRAGPGFGGMGPLLAAGQQQQNQDLPDQLFRGAPEGRGAGLLQESQRQALLPPGAFQPPAQQSNDPLGGIDLQVVGNAGRLLQPSPIAAKSIITPESVRPTKDNLPVPISSSTTQEESNLIDSLFAPSSGGGDESNLLDGLKGLSVGGNSWDGGAAGIPGWGDTQEKSRLPIMQQSHPNESRFQWGS